MYAFRARPATRVINGSRILGTLLLVAAFLFPVYWLVTLSFKTADQITTATPQWFFSPTLGNYRDVLSSGFFTNLLNSLFVGVVSTVLALVVGCSIAYPIARFRLRGSDSIMFWILSLWMLPPVVIVVPLYILYSNLGLLQTYWSLILTYTLMNVPLIVWIMHSFFKQFPLELEEAAQVDGASAPRIVLQIVLPLSAPGVVAAGLLSFIFAWNEFLFGNVLSGPGTQTGPPALTRFSSSMTVQWGQVGAAGTLLLLVAFLLALSVQRHLVRGLTLGAVK